MAGQTDQPQSQTGTTPVPDLIERYRLRRDAWIAQADELARLRDEVRGSAEREAMEIVTAARRDVRKIIMEARRELLVLSAQVQAALGEATPKTDRATLLNKAGITLDDSQPALLEGAVVAFAPEDAVKRDPQRSPGGYERARGRRENASASGRAAVAADCGAAVTAIAIGAGIFNVAGISDRELDDRARSYRTPNVLDAVAAAIATGTGTRNLDAR